MTKDAFSPGRPDQPKVKICDLAGTTPKKPGILRKVEVEVEKFNGLDSECLILNGNEIT